MRTFLSEVAGTLYERYGDDISSLNILFPSRRARLFFLDALSSIAERPLWQPRWLTIDDLMTRIAGFGTGDRLRLITELYKVYSQYHDESFDRFYFWGDMLLNDFDSIDKYLIDADSLFANINDLKQLEADISYLSEEQRRIVERFWRNFAEGGETDIKRNFMALWRTLGPIYNRYRERLSALGTGYTGMVHRAAADRIAAGTAPIPEGRYVVAGFNALSACEKRLFDYLKSAAEAEFFWDFDDYYVGREEQEAGMFVRENLSRYGSQSPVSHDNLRNLREATVVSTVSNVAQCKYAAEILDRLSENGPVGKETALVLTDENLLEPLMYSLPEQTGKVNVTMGYPFSHTAACSLVERLIDLQTRSREQNGGPRFYHADVTGILAHPYIAAGNAAAATLAAEIRRNRRIMVEGEVLAADELLARIFRRAGSGAEFTDYLSEAVEAVAAIPYEGDDSARRMEYLAVLAENIAKLRNSLAECDVEMNIKTCASLLRRHLRTVRIPFDGEPLEGVQIMGILETRNLDFRNVILLSADDDNFPGNRTRQSSFIPPNLRFAYGLPTPEHHEGVYAYYFYRLIQRCENLHILYCSHADEKSTGEPSRYIRQLEYETDIKINRTEAGVDVNLLETPPVEVAKTGATAERLGRYLAAENPAKLSPTAFSHYVTCPLQFWFADIARMKADEEISETVDNRVFGNIFHKAAQNVYSSVKGEFRAGERLREAISRAGEEIDRAINSEYLHDETARAEDYGGDVQLVRNVLVRCLRNTLGYDARNDGFRVEGLESKIPCEFGFETGGEHARVMFEGYMDRIDRMEDGSARVIDYKTGSRHLDFTVEGLFCGRAKERNVNILKTIMYAMMMSRSEGVEVRPSLYYVRSMHDEGYSPFLRRKGGGEGEFYSAYAAEFEEWISRTLSEMFDPTVPFRRCDDADSCRWCDFRTICDR